MKTFTATFANGYTATRKSSKCFEFAIAALDRNGNVEKVVFASDLIKAYSQRDRFTKKFGGHFNAVVVRAFVS
jgi:hypothetical protein